MVDVRVSFVQFPFGQVANLSNVLSLGTGPELSAGTESLPFLGESLPVVVGADLAWDFTSTIWPPWFRQSTVAV